MPKMFRYFTVITAAFLSANAIANSDFCMPAPKVDAPAEELPQPSREQLHQSMQQALTKAQQFDWVVDKTSPGLCDGYYQIPKNPNPQSSLNPEQADMLLSADNFEQRPDGFIYATGNVELYQGSRRLRCDSLRFSQEQQITELQGNIMLRQDGVLLLSEQATINAKEGSSEFINNQYLLSDIGFRGQAQNISGEGSVNQELTLKESSFTLCPPGDNTWLFSASELNFDQQQGWGSAKHTVLHVKDVPVFYFPYFTFPIDDRRKTGFLWPSISGGSDGLDISVPYYFNLAPDYDLTYIGRYLASHGYQHGVETRYKNRVSDWAIGGTYINDDKKIGDTNTKDNPSLDSSRWLGFVKHSGQYGQYWSTNINYQSVSDIEYFRDWGVKGLDVNQSSNIRRSANLLFSSDNWRINTEIVDYQRLELDASGNPLPEYYQLLPRTEFAYQGLSRPFNLQPIFYGQYSYFQHQTFAEAQRLYSKVGVGFPMRWQAFESQPEVKIKSLAYWYGDNPSKPNLQGQDDVHVATFSWNNQLHFERNLSFTNGQYQQTLSPRLFYYYAEDKEQPTFNNFDTSLRTFTYQQVFREERFNGHDIISDANQLSFGLEGNIFNQQDGELKLSFGIGQIFYFSDRNIDNTVFQKQTLQAINPGDTPAQAQQKLNDNQYKTAYNQHLDKLLTRASSDIAGEIQFYFNPQHSIISTAVYDPYDNRLMQFGGNYHYENQRQIFNLGISYERLNIINQEKTQQLDSSIYQPINQQWGLFARYNYDIEQHELIENIIGARFNNCCWSITLAWQKEREYYQDGMRLSAEDATRYDRSWYLQFEFHGLGSVSNSISRILRESIEGFEGF